MKLAGKVGVVVAGVVMVVGMGTASASADREFWQHHGDDRGRFRASDDVVIIEDREEDGHCAYVRWHYEGLSDSWKYLYDIDCAGSERGERDLGENPVLTGGVLVRSGP